MRTIGEFKSAQRSLEGDLTITFAVDDDEAILEWLEKAKDKKLVIEAKRYREQRSISANNYFWKLCDLIAQKLGTTQDEVHDLMLYRYGVRSILTFEKKMLKAMQETFDIVLALDEFEGNIEARCFVGSRFYNTEEMARLIDGTVQDAKGLGVDTLSPEETERLVREWGK